MLHVRLIVIQSEANKALFGVRSDLIYYIIFPYYSAVSVDRLKLENQLIYSLTKLKCFNLNRTITLGTIKYLVRHPGVVLCLIEHEMRVNGLKANHLNSLAK